MEKYSQFRDRGSGVAPFFPVPRESSGVYLPFHIFLFIIRLPLLVGFAFTYFVIFSWLPVPAYIKKPALWVILGIPGIWWIDLQIDGVKRGSLAKHQDRLPQPSSIIASSFTSPIDCLYLAAIFDPIFTASYPNTRLVQQISLAQAIWRALTSPQSLPPRGARLVPLWKLMKENPDSLIVVLPECTTSNGRGILGLSPSILTTPPNAKIFPVNLRYSPADVTTPVPGTYISFLWDLCAKPTHCIRVRIAEAVQLSGVRSQQSLNDFPARVRDDDKYTDKEIGASFGSAETLTNDDLPRELNIEERKVLDRIADDLARLGRAKRVGLGVQEKVDFIKVWTKTRRIW
ncbi:hypothetical protein BT63DRAFT_408279 [Microthyrium microscopicum]|uniref:Vacuolar protein sorting protein Vps66 n=1 Tax=Microthyrium microscopicum TaxID=703497 RepID=A0A6A6URP4_9PEZI|nr:hypothetical protein BT63DRAFT_408279 [Microthyrium microscopicum]